MSTAAQAKEFQNRMNTAVQGALQNIINICEALEGQYNQAINTLAGGNEDAKIPTTQVHNVQQLHALATKLKNENFKQMGGSRRRFRKRALIRGSYRKRRYSRG